MSKYVKKNLPPKTHCVNGHEFTPENTGVRPLARNPSINHRYCKECQKLRCRKRDKKDPTSRKARVNSNKLLMRKKKAQLVKYKGGSCLDCGGIFPACCYHFDHRNPLEKVSGIAQIMHRPMEFIKLEADKCDLVCANCHAIRTYGNALIGQKISASRTGKWKE